jgi:hypothetical protein
VTALSYQAVMVSMVNIDKQALMCCRNDIACRDELYRHGWCVGMRHGWCVEMSCTDIVGV